MSNQLTLSEFDMETANDEPQTKMVYLRSFLNSLYEKKDTQSSVLFARAFLVTNP